MGPEGGAKTRIASESEDKNKNETAGTDKTAETSETREMNATMLAS